MKLKLDNMIIIISNDRLIVGKNVQKLLLLILLLLYINYVIIYILYILKSIEEY